MTTTTISSAVIEPKTSPTFVTTRRTARTPILDDDVVTIKGRYLYVGGNSNTTTTTQKQQRFFIRGMAFPTPPPAAGTTSDNNTNSTIINGRLVNIQGWINVLEQLADETNINTIRVYEMDCGHSNVDNIYDEFLTRAAELGIYVIVVSNKKCMLNCMYFIFPPTLCSF